jgi:flagellar biosynthesis protein FliR
VSFDLFAPGFGPTLVLLALRVGGLVLVAPVFSARTVPGAVRTVVILLLTVVLAPAAFTASHGTAQITPATFLTEMVVGFAIGLGGAVLLAATEVAGDMMSTAMGLSGASLLDPLTGSSSSVLAQLAQLFAVTVLLSVDGHLVMLDALAASAHEVPVGTPLDVQRGAQAMLGVGGQLFLLGLRFAAPVIAASLIGNVALAILTRAAPQLNVLTVAFPIQIALGLTAMVASFAFLATYVADWPLAFESTIARIFGALTPG